MKKLTVFFVFLSALLFLIAGCSGRKSGIDDLSQPTTPTVDKSSSNLIQQGNWPCFAGWVNNDRHTSISVPTGDYGLWYSDEIEESCFDSSPTFDCDAEAFMMDTGGVIHGFSTTVDSSGDMNGIDHTDLFPGGWDVNGQYGDPDVSSTVSIESTSICFFANGGNLYKHNNGTITSAAVGGGQPIHSPIVGQHCVTIGSAPGATSDNVFMFDRTTFPNDFNTFGPLEGDVACTVHINDLDQVAGYYYTGKIAAMVTETTETTSGGIYRAYVWAGGNPPTWKAWNHTYQGKFNGTPVEFCTVIAHPSYHNGGAYLVPTEEGVIWFVQDMRKHDDPDKNQNYWFPNYDATLAPASIGPKFTPSSGWHFNSNIAVMEDASIGGYDNVGFIQEIVEDNGVSSGRIVAFYLGHQIVSDNPLSHGRWAIENLTPLWTSQSYSNPSNSSPAIDGNGNIYVTTDDSILIFDPYSSTIPQESWTFNDDYGPDAVHITSPVVEQYGTGKNAVYFMVNFSNDSSRMFAISDNNDNSMEWPPLTITAPVLLPNEYWPEDGYNHSNQLEVPFDSGSLDPSQNPAPTYNYTSVCLPGKNVGRPATGPDGGLYVPMSERINGEYSSGRLVKYCRDGLESQTPDWTFSSFGNLDIICIDGSPALSADGLMVFCIAYVDDLSSDYENTYLFGLSTYDGDILFSQPLGKANAGNSPVSPTLTDEGDILVPYQVYATGSTTKARLMIYSPSEEDILGEVELPDENNVLRMSTVAYSNDEVYISTLNNGSSYLHKFMIITNVDGTKSLEPLFTSTALSTTANDAPVPVLSPNGYYVIASSSHSIKRLNTWDLAVSGSYTSLVLWGFQHDFIPVIDNSNIVYCSEYQTGYLTQRMIGVDLASMNLVWYSDVFTASPRPDFVLSADDNIFCGTVENVYEFDTWNETLNTWNLNASALALLPTQPSGTCFDTTMLSTMKPDDTTTQTRLYATDNMGYVHEVYMDLP